MYLKGNKLESKKKTKEQAKAKRTKREICSIQKAKKQLNAIQSVRPLAKPNRPFPD